MNTAEKTWKELNSLSTVALRLAVAGFQAGLSTRAVFNTVAEDENIHLGMIQKDVHKEQNELRPSFKKAVV